MTDIKDRLGDYHHALSSDDRQIALERIEYLEREVDFLRRYGNKDCTAMADEALADDKAGFAFSLTDEQKAEIERIDINERLRHEAMREDILACEIMQEAADRIEELERERDNAEGALSRRTMERDDLRGRIEELEAALNDKTRDHRKTVDVKTRPVAKVAWRYRPVTLGDAIERIEELEAIGKRLLYHDERGQGVGWQEAMHDLATTLE